MIDVLTAILYVKVDKVKRRAGTKLGRDYSANAGLMDCTPWTGDLTWQF
jgi:hypothetical protein